MRSLFNAQDSAEIIARIEKLDPGSVRQWGKMNVSQMMAHCNKALGTAMGDHYVKRVFIGRILAPLIRRTVLGEKPFRKNSPTDKSYLFPVDVVFEEEKPKLIASVKKFSSGGPAAATLYPHAFFGKFTPDQWGIFEWKHLDHHLRQFGV